MMRILEATLTTFGLEGQIAVITICEGLLFCVWTSMNSYDRIQFIGGIKRGPDYRPNLLV